MCWLLLLLTMIAVASAGLKKYRFHRLMANQVVKGAITVPAARLAGAAAQRLWPQLGEANGYYLGIFAVVLVIAVWEMSEIYAYIVRPCAASPGNKKQR